MIQQFNIKIAVLITALLLTACAGRSQPPQQVEYLPTAPGGQSTTPATTSTHSTTTVATSTATAAVATSTTTAAPNAVASVTAAPSGALSIDFSSETVGSEPTSFIPAVGYWLVGVDGDNPVLVVDGSKWSQGQSSSNIAEQARALYGDRYAEFLDNVQAYAYYPFAVAKDVENFTNGEITLRFKIIAGNIDQNAGILFGLQPNGDYYTFRASTLENNVVLWQVVKGQRSSLEWIRNTPATSGQWHELKVVINGSKVEGYLDGKLYLMHTFDIPPSGKIGVWSKSDSVTYFDDFTVTPSQ